MVTGRYPVTLHHCHGGSMLSLGPEFPNPGMAQKQNPFLQIPLHAEYHVGPWGIDSKIGRSVKDWEGLFGSQLFHLERVNDRLPYDIWQQAKLWASQK
jgi:hypothetical protein